jgi:tRNA (guanine-N7-)-methyltransferase
MPAKPGDIAADGTNKRRVYGRRLGKPLRGGRLDAIETLLPKLQFTPEMLPENATLDPATLFEKPYEQLWFEIGFGNGEHVAALMERHPSWAFIAAEPFINGMSAFLKDIAGKRHDHVRVLMDDALLVVDTLKDSCVDGFYVLNPDPWPKARHHKRRIISQPNLNRYARVLKPGGQLIMATDVDDLADWMRDEATAHPAFRAAYDSRTAPQDWIPTRYEQKGARAGRSQTYLIFERV